MGYVFQGVYKCDKRQMRQTGNATNGKCDSVRYRSRATDEHDAAYFAFLTRFEKEDITERTTQAIDRSKTNRVRAGVNRPGRF